MDVLKKVTLLVTATVAIVLVVGWSVHLFGFRSFISAVVVNWVVVCWIATASLILNFSLPSSYYETKSFEAGQLYERLGVRFCKKLLRRGPLRILSPKLRIPNPIVVESLRELEYEMRRAETIHVVAFIVMMFVAGYGAVRGWLDALSWMLLFNVLLNIYPMMLQRHNRMKLQRLIGSINGKAIGVSVTQHRVIGSVSGER